MNFSNLDRDIARLILLQRTELISPILARLRKIFGRYFFTNFLSKYLISPSKINRGYYQLMLDEYNDLKKNIIFENKKILSVGSGMGGLEIIINSSSKNNFFTFIEKNYVSKKVLYGWDKNNNEAYNNLYKLKDFITNNGINVKNFEVYDFDNDVLPIKNYDLVISLYSLDYHYDFSFYIEYLRKISNENTQIIFDTIRPEYFQKVFKNVDIIKNEQKSIHGSKRVVCNKFKKN